MREGAFMMDLPEDMARAPSWPVQAAELALALREMACLPLPAALAAAWPGLLWRPHPRLDWERPRLGALLTSRRELGGGRWATVVFGFDEGEGKLSFAAREGDEARSNMLACFEPWTLPPRQSAESRHFAEAAPESDVGERSAVVESSKVEDILLAARIVERLPSAWEGPWQEQTWRAASAGDLDALRQALAREPRWAAEPWGAGSSALALCSRLGRWDALALVRSFCPAELGQEVAAQCAQAIADWACEASVGEPWALAGQGLLRAWKAGAFPEPLAWRGAFGADAVSQAMARLTWREAERAWLGEREGVAAARAKRL
jgi:hypothetical protein